jgi:SAM-dependent methyltransferase
MKTSLSKLKSLLFDLRYGGSLRGAIPSRFDHLGAYETANSGYRALDVLFAAAQIDDTDVIVDVGCGKGRVINWVLRHHPRSQVYGIEIDPDLCLRTTKRLRRFRNARILCGDAVELLPPEGTIFYLYNPFGEDVMRRFIAAFLAHPSPDRKRRIVYHNSVFLKLFEADPRFKVHVVPIPNTFKSAVIYAL